MSTAADIVAAARACLGTPFVHQGRVRGVGLDCLGLMWVAARDAGVPIPDGQGYVRNPNPQRLRAELIARLDPISINEIRAGDLGEFWIYRERLPQHVAVFCDYPGGGLSLLHALYDSHGTVEHRFTEYWRRRLVAAYRFRGLDASK